MRSVSRYSTDYLADVPCVYNLQLNKLISWKSAAKVVDKQALIVIIDRLFDAPIGLEKLERL